jgi:prepilin peptidase dependent protein B
MSGRRQQGLSLVELMVGIAIGLMIVATATMLMSHQLNDARRLGLEMQVEQDLRAAVDLVARDLRRAGYSPNAIDSNPYAEVVAGDAAEPSHAVGYARALDADDAVTARERSGVKLDTGTLKLLLGDSGWQAITDPEVVTVTRFNVAVTTHRLPLAGACDCPAASAGPCPPVQELRAAHIELAGVATRDPRVRRSLQADVRLRNDRILGRCGA